jgi:DNA processing protein
MNACGACLRRARLVAELAGYLDHLHAKHGLYDEVFSLGNEELLRALVPEPADRARIRDSMKSIGLAHERSRAGARGLVMTCRHDDDYPGALRDLAGPPPVVWALGGERLGQLLDPPAVAIVGARRATSYGIEVARGLGRGLASAGVCVVSGMALGIDSAAHAGALESSGRTVAVMAGGADVPYPRSKRGLHAELGERGAVLAEMPPGSSPRRWAFPARNRIIAALASLTLVVEAGERSGALITARAARELGRDVAAVPGPITSPPSAGPNALLRDGAHLVDGPQSVLDLLFGVGVRHVERSSRKVLEPRLRALLDEVRAGRNTLGALTDAGEEVADVMAALGELELIGRIRRAPGGAYVPLA